MLTAHRLWMEEPNVCFGLIPLYLGRHDRNALRLAIRHPPRDPELTWWHVAEQLPPTPPIRCVMDLTWEDYTRRGPEWHPQWLSANARDVILLMAGIKREMHNSFELCRKTRAEPSC